MKKVYESPEIAVEFFELTQAIANCSLKIGLNDSQCVLNDGDATGEMKSLAALNYFGGGCSTFPIGMDEDDGVCYHTNVNMAVSS